MKHWSFAYAFVKQIVRAAMWLVHKRISVIGETNIPPDTPVIFAPNHQNALMDPLAVLCTSRTQPVWLARADIFKLKAARPILRFLKIMPVYRFRDGKDNLGKNEEVFAQAIEVLENKRELALFPEAAHSGKRQMLAHKKAIPRIAFLAEEKNNFQLNLHIIPVGIYYSHYWHLNRELIVHYGEPILVKDYEAEFKRDSHKANMALRNEISKRVEALTINIKSKEYYDNYELMRELVGADYAHQSKADKNRLKNRFYSDQKLISLLEEKEASQPTVFGELHQQLTNYRETLNQLNIHNQQVSQTKLSAWYLVKKSFGALLLLPLFLLGFILHLIPFFIPRHFIQRKVKDQLFYGSVQFVVGLIIYSVIGLVLGIVFYRYTQDALLTLCLLLGFWLLGKLAYQAMQFLLDLINNVRFFLFARKDPNQSSRLLRQKAELRNQLFQLIND
ncbi:1-acyl-sn-glycerol-3-phosphate acyltransferase [uncultured Sunxiuqinia sp.]|uniref:1-acyl-sn-glycerol-3-phosphate acyltransferase n=1 Tax=uncultured Sunxiuqinia sp. TaxID=1573825 RepID=UPI0026104156|nr:1-acyl-sn-glycerol-3-phosphate acyltransferase [uncultured Sunxiuqinia sp.]